jgi:hypothetical protein
MSFKGMVKYRILRGKNGRLTVAIEQDSGEMISLSPRNDPVANVLHTLSRIAPGPPVALCGLADGWVLSALAEFAQPVILIEPDPHLLLMTLFIHDYAGPHGPIRQDRFHWLIGPNWKKQTSNIPANSTKIVQGFDRMHIEAELTSLECPSCA